MFKEKNYHPKRIYQFHQILKLFSPELSFCEQDFSYLQDNIYTQNVLNMLENKDILTYERENNIVNITYNDKGIILTISDRVMEHIKKIEELKIYAMVCNILIPMSQRLTYSD